MSTSQEEPTSSVSEPIADLPAAVGAPDESLSSLEGRGLLAGFLGRVAVVATVFGVAFASSQNMQEGLVTHNWPQVGIGVAEAGVLVVATRVVRPFFLRLLGVREVWVPKNEGSEPPSD